MKFVLNIVKHKRSFDLHALSTPPAFILSQDQTLKIRKIDLAFLQKVVMSTASCPVVAKGDFTGSQDQTLKIKLDIKLIESIFDRVSPRILRG